MARGREGRQALLVLISDTVCLTHSLHVSCGQLSMTWGLRPLEKERERETCAQLTIGGRYMTGQELLTTTLPAAYLA